MELGFLKIFLILVYGNFVIWPIKRSNFHYFWWQLSSEPISFFFGGIVILVDFSN